MLIQGFNKFELRNLNLIQFYLNFELNNNKKLKQINYFLSLSLFSFPHIFILLKKNNIF